MKFKSTKHQMERVIGRMRKRAREGGRERSRGRAFTGTTSGCRFRQSTSRSLSEALRIPFSVGVLPKVSNLFIFLPLSLSKRSMFRPNEAEVTHMLGAGLKGSRGVRK